MYPALSPMRGSISPVGPIIPNTKLSTSVLALIYALALKLSSSGLATDSIS